MRNKIAQKFISLGIATIFLFFSFSSRTQVITSCTNQSFNDLYVKSADYWDLTGSPILIDDSDPTSDWAFTIANYDWCSGSGTWDEPYIIKNITIDGLASGRCIEIRYSKSYFKIVNCTISNSGLGTEDAGIYLFRTDNAYLVNNTCSSNANFGIYLDDCKNISLFDNIVNDNWKGIRVYRSINNSIIGNVAKYNNEGIEIYESDDTRILNNLANENGWAGIDFYDCDNNIALKNIANQNQFGFYIHNSNYNEISGNAVINNTEAGILIFGCLNYTVNNNFMNNSIDGLNLHSSLYGKISSNKMSFCDNGVHLYTSHNNVFSVNQIRNNTRGIFLDHEGWDNLFYKNYFIGNVIHAIDNSTHGDWNASIVGNYWDNYTGSDTNNDGIGDTPYFIPGTIGSIDYLPIYGNPFILPNQIHIDGTGIYSYDWNWAATRSWCNGLGTSQNPFIIEDLTFDAGNSGDGILIGNSSVFFIIRNVTCLNFYQQPNAGINLFNTTNGQLLNNNCTSNSESIGVYLRNSNSTVISGNIANNIKFGLYLKDSNNNTIIGNNYKENMFGIQLDDSIKNNISGNNVSDGDWGIVLYSNYNNIQENEIGDMYYDGIYTHSGQYNSIFMNKIDYCDSGIFMTFSTFCNYYGNTITNCQYGIYVNPGENNNITSNILDKNDYGLVIEAGFVYGPDNNIIKENLISQSYYWGMHVSSESNLIYRNNFTSNPIHAIDDSNDTYWDNGAIGNYWDDYTGEDKNDDGIGDTPYNITGSAKSKDNYPIWRDGDDLPPVIIINSPHSNQSVGRTAPNFNVRIIDPNLDSLWYTIDHGITNVSFTANSTINQALWETLWDSLAINDVITIVFYANDTLGNIGYNDVEVIKTDIDDGTIEDIPGYDIILIIGVVTMTSLISIKIGKKQKNYRT